MNIKKIRIALTTILLAIVVVYSLWRYPPLLIIAILLIAYFKHVFAPLKKELIMFLVSAIVGAGGESIIMFGGPWSYATPTIVNFPIWLPFLWGLAGITGISLYQGITED